MSDEELVIGSLFDDEELIEESLIGKMAGIIGRVAEFDSNEETWSSYVERFELFIDCNNIKQDKRVSTLLTVVGVKTFNLLRDLCTPDKPSTKTYEELVKLIEDHLYPKPSFIAERYKFSHRNQRENETIAEYVASLKKLSTHCEFGAALNDYLRDRIVSGIRNESTKQRLLAETALTFDKAVKMIASVEAAEKDAASLAFEGSSQPRLQKIEATQRSHSSKQPTEKSSKGVKVKSVTCYCCGKMGHYKSECKLKGVVCYKCGKKNHIAKVCQSNFINKSQNKGINCEKNDKKDHPKSRKIHPKHNFINSNDDDIISDISNLYQLNDMNHGSKPSKVYVKPIKIDVVVENKPINFEIDTGAAYSVISEKFYQENFNFCKLLVNDLKLSSYTNDPIIPIGKIKVNVNYAQENKRLDLYVIKDGAHPLIGRDWMKILNIEVSINNNHIFTIAKNKNYRDEMIKKLINEFPSVFNEKLGEYKGEPVKLIVKHDAKPKYFKPRPLPYALKNKVERELERLVEQDVLYPVNSTEWGTPIVPVIKKNGSIRICGDFKVTLNPVLEIDRHPLPRIEDLFAELQKGELYSKIDLSEAYMQLKLDEESQKLCTISTHKGLFSYKRLPYGINSGPSLFQKKIEQTLQGLQGVIVFLDDILITGFDQENHFNRLQEVCKRLASNGFTVKKEKCDLFSEKLEYLGFIIDKNGLHTSPDKLKAIVEAPFPRNVSEVKSFLGLVNYYGKFISNMSTVLSPIYQLLKKNVTFNFNKKCIESFNTIKKLLTTSPVLAHYDPTLPIKLSVDASNVGVGSVLSIVCKDGKERPIAYASRTLSPAERNYSQIDKEALAVVVGIKKFHQYLYGRHFTLCSDHKPLISIFGPKKGLPMFAASRLQRYALFLSGYDYDIQYVKSSVNNADILSRLPLNVKHPTENSDCKYQGTYLHLIYESSIPLSCEDIKKETQKDLVLKKIMGYVKHGWPNLTPEEGVELKAFYQRKDELAVEQGILMWGYKVVIPSSLRNFVLKDLHSSHLGIVKMKSVARSYFWWPKIDNDIERIANSCSSCLLERANPAKSEIHNWHYPNSVWERLHLDYLGPFKEKMYLIVVDAYSKWLEVFEINSTSAKLAIKELRQLFARFGLPMSIHTDNGPPFNSEEFASFLKHNGIKHTTSAPYHPQSNGQAENSVKFVKQNLKKAFRDNIDVNLALIKILFDYRNSVHATTNESPAQLMFKRSLRTRFDLLRPNFNKTVELRKEKQKQYAKGSPTRYLISNQSVLVRDYRSKNKWVEGVIIKQLSPVMYLIMLNSGIIWKRHVDQIVAVTAGEKRDMENDMVTQSIAERQLMSVPAEKARLSPRPAIEGSHKQPTPTRVGSSPSQTRSPLRSGNKKDTENKSEVRVNEPGSTRRYPERNRKPVVRLDL